MEKSKYLNRLKSSKDFSQCKKSLNALISLKNNKKVWKDYNLLNKMTPKISVRLRNSVYSRTLEQLSKLCKNFNKLIQDFPFDELKNLFENEFFNIDTIKQKLAPVCLSIETLAVNQFKSALLARKAFSLSQIWLDLGQLINHFLIISSIASRIFIFSKTFLVYFCDVYNVVLNIENFGVENPKENAVETYLVKLNIGLRKNLKSEILNYKMNVNIETITQPCDSINKVLDLCSDDNNESLDLGVPLNRNVYNQTIDAGIITQTNKRKRKNNKLLPEKIDTNVNQMKKSKKRKKKKVNAFNIE